MGCISILTVDQVQPGEILIRGPFGDLLLVPYPSECYAQTAPKGEGFEEGGSGANPVVYIPEIISEVISRFLNCLQCSRVRMVLPISKASPSFRTWLHHQDGFRAQIELMVRDRIYPFDIRATAI